jgi:hypothetical protein
LIRRIVVLLTGCLCLLLPPAGFASAGLSIKGNRAAAFPLVAAAGPSAAAPVADLDGRPAAEKQSIIVIDNYDSFTYNLCQVFWRSMLFWGVFPCQLFDYM